MNSIEWTGPRRWPIVTGCTACGAACDHCWAARLAATRLKHHPHYKGLAEADGSGGYRWTGKIRLNLDIVRRPLSWRKPQLVFPVHTGDLFHPGVDNFTLHRIFGVFAATPHITFQVLTKRPGRAAVYLALREHVLEINKWQQLYGRGGPIAWPLPNVWLGTSVWDQRSAATNIAPLLDAPAARRFISAEPLLGPLDLTALGVGRASLDALGGRRRSRGVYDTILPSIPSPRLDWVIVGGESGPGARPPEVDWVRDLRDACIGAGVAFFFKQWGGAGRGAAGRLIDGLEYLQMPERRPI